MRLMKRASCILLSFMVLYCSKPDPEPRHSLTVETLLAEFYANRPNAGAFNSLSEEQRWQFLAVYLPGRVFRVGPTEWIKFLPDGSALFQELVNYGTYEREAIGMRVTPGNLRWELTGNALHIRGTDSVGSVSRTFGAETHWMKPEILSDRVFVFYDGRGGELGLILDSPRDYIPPFLDMGHQFPQLGQHSAPQEALPPDEGE